MEAEMRMMWRRHGICGTRRGLCDGLGTRRLWSAGDAEKPCLPKSAVSSHGVLPPGGRGGFAREWRCSANLFNVSEVIYDPVCAVFHNV